MGGAWSWNVANEVLGM